MASRKIDTRTTTIFLGVTCHGFNYFKISINVKILTEINNFTFKNVGDTDFKISNF